MKLSDYKKSGFDHANFEAQYENDNNEDNTISSKFLSPALRHCKEFHRTTYSFSSATLKGWAGSFTNIIDDNVQIKITCDMRWFLDNADSQLRIALENKSNVEYREKIIRDGQHKILLKAFKFDINPEDYDARADLLDWLIANDQLKLKFAYPKELFQPGKHDPLFHKKIGYFVFPDDSLCAFRGSWNETEAGAAINDEDVSVYSGNDPKASKWLDGVVISVDKYWKEEDKKFDFFEPNKEIIEMIKNRAPKKRPNIDDKKSSQGSSSTELTKVNLPNESNLRDYQIDVIESWEKNGRKGLVEHATGTGKTWTALFAMKRHFKDNQVSLIVVPSDILQKQWSEEVKKLIPDARILNVGGDYTGWKKELTKFSKPNRDLESKVIIAIVNSASSKEFRNKLFQGRHLLFVADEVHRLGSDDFSKTLTIDSGSRLGLSATPKRYGDPVGTEKIYDYFENSLKPKIHLKDVIGKTLVPYQYFPKRCYLNEQELGDWDELTRKIAKAYASSPTKDGKKIPSQNCKLLQIKRARIAKSAKSKIKAAVDILNEHYLPSKQWWLIYCESLVQLEELYEELINHKFTPMQYYSAMDTESKKTTLSAFVEGGGILISINCLDEGVDIPPISHALIIASDQNPRQFIQRRGRVLRMDEETDKKRAYLHDLVVTADPNSSQEKTETLMKAELKRAYEFASNAENSATAQTEMRLIARETGIDIEQIINKYNEEIDNLED